MTRLMCIRCFHAQVPDSPSAVFEWLIAPVKPQEFFESTWEQKPLHIKRPGDRNHFEGVFGKVSAAFRPSLSITHRRCPDLSRRTLIAP